MNENDKNFADDDDIFEDDGEIRDQMAALALCGLLSNENTSLGNMHEIETPSRIAKRAYEYADAMMKARRRTH